MLQLNFEGIPVEPGATMSTRNLRFAPKWGFSADPESTFTLVMIGKLLIALLSYWFCCIDMSIEDPDNLSREKPTVAEWLHWLVTNIPASNLIEGINGGQHQQAYGSLAFALVFSVCKFYSSRQRICELKNA